MATGMAAETQMGPPTTTAVPLGTGLEAGSLQVFGLAPPGAGSPSLELGACPHSQRVYMALEERGLPFVITGIDEQSMPSWLTEINKNAEIPALRDGDEYVFGADDILSHVNDRYPEQSSAFLVPEAQLQQIETITSALVETFMKWMESKSKDSPVRTEYEDAVVELNKHLEKNGPYLCGTSPTDADFKVAPLLHHARVTLLNVMDFELPKKYAAVHKYIALMEGRASFQKYNQPDELIVSSWQRKFGMQAQTA